MKQIAVVMSLAGAALTASADAALTIPMHFVDESGPAASAGQVSVTETKYGLVFTPALAGLPPGLHGFHVHENPSCLTVEREGKKLVAMAAGGHLDPAKSGKHDFPWGEGHLGDLPPLYVGADGKATQPVLTPRLSKLAELKGRSLMVHAGADNHADHPAPLGGGGARIACGVIAP